MRLVMLFTYFPLSFFLLEEGAYTFNDNESQRSETDFHIHISVQYYLMECALVAEAVKLFGTGEGTNRRIFTLSKHFDDPIFFTGRSTSCWVTNFSNSFYFLAKTNSFCPSDFRSSSLLLPRSDEVR